MMAMRGQAVRDSSGYGFYEVRLNESLRREIAPVNNAVADSLMKQSDDEDAPIVEPEKKPSFFQRIFGKKDTVAKKKEEQRVVVDPKQKLKADIDRVKEEEQKKEELIDTSGKTRKEIRQEKRRLRNEAKDKEKALKQAAGQ